jgi:NAD(P)-dependent dehydrogenase (short-subunit alcohol dehydrogenase family)
MLSSLLDRVLDATVIPGYTSLGYRVRRLGWDDSDLKSLDGAVVLVTGATSGLGLAAAEGFARLGASVRLLARSQERGERAREAITQRTGNRDILVSLCDLSDLDSIRDFVAGFHVEESRLDVLVNNAGAMLHERRLSAEGIEMTFATNVLGPFLLTNLLLELLKASAPARIVNVSSGGMYTQRLDVEDLQSERGKYDGTAAYARSKRAEVVLTELWAERLTRSGVVVHAMHPGWADTPGVQSSLPGFHRLTRPLLRTPAEGADTIVWLGSAAEPARSSGCFWHDRRARPTYRLPGTRETRQDDERLWSECERLSGWHQPLSTTTNNFTS